MEVQIKLDEFSGPMDLLLDLIKKDEIDIWEISISKITSEYIKTIEKIEIDPHQVADFLQMAAYLLEIKSKMLLPENKYEYDKSTDNARKDLINALISYQKIKNIYKDLQIRDAKYQNIFYSDTLFVDIKRDKAINLEFQLDKFILKESFEKVLFNSKRYNNTKFFQKLDREKFSVKDKQREVLSILSYEDNFSFNYILKKSKHSSEWIASFLAVLKLQQDKRVKTTQKNPFDEIFVRRS